MQEPSITAKHYSTISGISSLWDFYSKFTEIGGPNVTIWLPFLTFGLPFNVFIAA